MTTSLQQPALFLETAYDALKEAVRYLGGAKVVGARLWPQKSVADARDLLNHCLDANRSEKLDIEQIILILRWAREAGFHGAKHWMDEACGYEPSVPLDPAVQRDRAIDVLAEASANLARALKTVQDLQAKSGLRSAA